MNATITRTQEYDKVKGYEAKLNDDEYQMTTQDNILACYIENGKIRKGILQNGLTVDEFMEIQGYDLSDFRLKCQVRVQMCQFAASLIKDSIPFGGLKDGGIKKYGFTNKKEWEELSRERKKRLITEVHAGVKFLEETDSLMLKCRNVIKEYDNQLKLPF
jgi:hypothetical protein